MRKKVCKKIIVVLLLFIFAADGLNSNFNILNVIEIKAATTTVTRAQWIHSLVDMTGMKVEDNQLPDNYYNDVNKKTEYYDDIMKATAYGVIDTAAGKDFKPEEKVSREFVAHTLNFCMGFQLDEKKYTFSDDNDCTYKEDDQIAINQGWLSLESGKFVPKGEVSETDIKNISKNVKEILSKQEVKEDYDSTWNVVSGVKTIPATTEAVIEDNKVIITDLTQKINTGDIFVVYQGEVGVPLKAENISVTGNKTIITTTDVKDYDNAFSKVDAEGIIESDELTFEPLDGTQLDVTTENRQKGTGVNRAVKKVKTVSFNKTFKVIGNLSSSVKGTLKNVQVKYNILTSTGEVMVQVEGDLNMTGTIKAAANTSIDIMAVKIPGIGGLTLTANVDAEGKFSSTVTSHMLTGISYSKVGGFRTIKSFKENGGSNTAVEASASIGATLKFGITDLKLITGYVYGKAGVTAQFNDTVWATGTPGNCRTFLAYMYASYGAEASCMFKKDLYSKNTDIYTLQNSPMRVYHHYEDGRLVSKCSRGLIFDYFTKYYSAYGSSGWSGYNGSAGLDDEGKEYQIYKYSLSNDEDGNKVATITEYYGNARNLEIPEEIDGYKVVGIGYGAFSDHKEILQVTIPDSVEKLSNSAFMYCSNLQSVSIPKDVNTDADAGYLSDLTYRGPFYGCDSLKNITFAKGTTIINTGLFHGCGIEKLELPDTVTVIGNRAFKECTKLTDAGLTDNIKKLGDEAFGECTSLRSVCIPKDVETGSMTGMLGGDVGPFYGCTSLKNIQFAKGTTVIHNGLFHASGIEQIKIPDTVTKIENNVFKRCNQLKDVTLSDSVTELGNGAFQECIKLTSIYIPKNIKTSNFAGDDAWNPAPFTGCSELKTIQFAKGTTDISRSLLRNTGLEKIELPDTIKNVGEYAFAGCENLEEVKLANGTEQLKKYAFKDSALKEIELPRSIKTIGIGAFLNCKNLSKVTLSDGLEEISEDIFSGCKGLKEIVIPESILKINRGAFENSGMETITMPSKLTEIKARAFKGSSLKNIKFSWQETIIGDEAFANCDYLEKIQIPDSVTDFGVKVFQDSDMLTDVKLGTGIKEVPSNTFEHCDKLTKIIIPRNVIKIGDNAFANCVALTDIIIPKATKEISENAFSYPEKITITGIAGSYAETFAKDHDIKFTGRTVKATKATLSDTNVTLKKNDKKQLSINVTPEDFTDDVNWKSSNTDVATVDENGLITAKAGGTAIIKVTVGELSLSCEVTVEQPIEKIWLNEYSLKLDGDGQYQLTAEVGPDNANNKEVTWTSSDTKIATVDQKGMVKAVSKGTATITATAKDGSNVSRSCIVTVRNNIYNITDISKMESSHPYENNCTDEWIYTEKDAKSLEVTFDSKTEFENKFDYLYIYDKDKKQVGKYTGTELAGKTIEVPGNTLRIQLQTDNGGNAYGFKVAEIKAKQDNTVRPPTTEEPKPTPPTTEEPKQTPPTTEESKPTPSVTEEPKPSTTTHKPESTEQKEIKLTRIVLSGISTKIAAGKKIKLTSFILPENASNKKLIWKTSNTKYATVSSNGIITINKKAGGKTVIITATAKDGSGKKATYKIKIMKGKVKKIVISGAKTVKVGKTISLKTKITATRGANKKIKWTSSNTKYATVSSSGKVKALKAGKKKTVKITAMATDGSGKKATKIIKIK